MAVRGRKKRLWTNEQTELLREGVARRVPARQLARELGRTEGSVRSMVHILGLSWKVGSSGQTQKQRLMDLLRRGSMSCVGQEFTIDWRGVGEVGRGSTVEEVVRDAERRVNRLLRPAAKA